MSKRVRDEETSDERKVPQARWRPDRRFGADSDGSEEITIKAMFSASRTSSVDHLTRLLTAVGKFTEFVRLIFVKPGIPCVDLPGCDDAEGDNEANGEEAKLGAVRVVFERSSGNLLMGASLSAEVQELSKDEQSVLIRTAPLLAFLKKIDVRSDLEIVKYRDSVKLYLKWTNEECPGRWEHVAIGQVADTAESLDKETVQKNAWEMMRLCSRPAPHFKVIVSVKELQRVMASVRLEAGGGSDKSGPGKKSSGSQSIVEFEFLVPEKIDETELRQVELHVGGIYAVDTDINFYQRYLLRESPPSHTDLQNEPLIGRGLLLDLTLQDHHILAQDRRRDNYDVACHERFSGDLFKDVLEAISVLHPFQDKITIVFYLPDELDWDSDFANHPGNRVGRRPIGIQMDADKTTAFFYLVAQTITD